MLETDALLLALAVIFLAGITQSLTGFGFGLVAVPLLTLLVEPRVALPIVMVDGIILNLIILRQYYASIQARRIWVLALAGMIGSPVGVWILAHWDVHFMRIYIGVLTCLAASVFLFGFRRVISRESLASVPVGFVSGIMSGSISMSGPPVILFFSNQNMPRQVFRANIVAYFLALQAVGLATMAASGLLTSSSLASSALLLPSLAAGAVVGTIFAGRVDDIWVRRVTLMIVSFAGVLSVLSGLRLI